MKLRLPLSLLLAAALCPASIVLAQPPPVPSGLTVTDVTLYYSPDATSTVAKKVSPNHPALASAKPHPDAAKSAAGWQIVEITETFTGYAPMDSIRKDLSVRPGVMVLQEPKADAPALGPALENPPTRFESAGREFAKVTYPGALSLSFQKLPAPSAPLGPKPVVATPPPAPKPVAVAPPAPAPVILPVQSAVAVSGANTADLPRYYTGVLKMRTQLSISGPASAQYLLYDANGRLVSLVDISGVLLNGPINNYLGKPVKIYGVAEATKSDPNLILKAQLIQFN